MFCIAKGRLLQRKRRPFAMLLTAFRDHGRQHCFHATSNIFKNSLLTPGTAVNNGFGFGYRCLVCLNFSHNLLLGFLLWHSNALPPEYWFLCDEGIRLRCSSPSCRMFRFQTLPMTLCQSFPKQSPSHGHKCRPYSARTQAARYIQPHRHA